MENLLSRYRNVTILVAVLFAEIIGLAIQVKRNTDTASTRLIRVWIVETVTPLEKTFEHAQDGLHNIWHNYFYLRGVRAENRALQDQIQQLKMEQVRLNEDAQQARRLQLLLSFKEQFISQTTAAQVIGASGSDISRVLYIDKGSNDGLRQDMPVMTANGIVGKILRAFPSSSQVLLINDSSSGVGAILEKSRLQGVLKGTAAGDIVLEKVMADEQVQIGDRVITSGGDQIFPKGLPIGTVRKVSAGPDLFLSIRVKPDADLSRVEEVLVITKVDQKAPEINDASGPVRAIDILAARLPSVPDKPAAGAGKPGAATSGTPTAPTGVSGTVAVSAAQSTTQPAGTVKPSSPAEAGAQKAPLNSKPETFATKAATPQLEAQPSAAKAKTSGVPGEATGNENAPTPSKTSEPNKDVRIPPGPRTRVPHAVSNPVAETAQPAGEVPHQQ